MVCGRKIKGEIAHVRPDGVTFVVIPAIYALIQEAGDRPSLTQFRFVASSASLSMGC